MDRIAKLESLRRRLENRDYRLLLIKEKESEFVLSTDVPLDLIQEERATEGEITALKAQIAELEAAIRQAGGDPTTPINAARANAAPDPARWQKYLVKLSRILNDKFAPYELKDICWQLGIDYDNLPGAAKLEKARELVEYLDNRDRIPDLVSLGKRERPSVSWDDA